MKILNNNYICAIDISSSKVAAVVVKTNKRNITDIFFEMMPSRGIKGGSIVDSIDLIACVEAVMKNLKAKSGINIKYLYTDFSGQGITTGHSHAIIPLAERGNKVITLSDIARVNEQARILGSSLEEEIIDEVPFSYAIDSKNNISNPLGLYSHRLEVDLYLVCAKLSSIQTLTRVVNQAGYEIKDLFFSATSTSYAVFDKNIKKGVNVLCDIGSDISEILIFRDGMLKNVEILNHGGDDLTVELAEVLKIPVELAEDVKRSYASIQDFSRAHPDKEILVKKNNIYKPIKQSLVIETVTSRAKLISEAIKKKIEANVSPIEIDNFVVCGRTILSEGFLEMLESNLGVSVKLGRVTNPQMLLLVNNNSDSMGQKYLTYLVCLGMISRILNDDQSKMISASEPVHNPVFKIINKFKEVYQEYF